MKTPTADHPMWSLIRLTIVGTFLLCMLAFTYNSFVWEKDGRTLAVVVGALGAVEFAASRNARSRSQPEST